MKKYNIPHQSQVIKTRLTEEEYAEFPERVTLCKMSQAEFIRQALIKSSIRPVITMSFWTEQDVLEYTYHNHIPIADVYGEVVADYGKGKAQGDSTDMGIFDVGKPIFNTTGCNRTGRKRCN